MAAWSLKGVPVPTAWYIANKIGLADGAAVGTWPDESGNGRDLTQAVAANKPLLQIGLVDGMAAVDFDGTNDYLATALAFDQFIAAAAGTIYAVVRRDVGAGVGVRSIVGRDSGSSTIALFFETAETTLKARNNDGALDEVTKTVADDGGWHLLVWQHNSGSLRVFADDQDEAAGVGTPSGDTQNIATATLSVGAATASGFFKGEMAELIFANVAHTQEQRRLVTRYLLDSYPSIADTTTAPLAGNPLTSNEPIGVTARLGVSRLGASRLGAIPRASQLDSLGRYAWVRSDGAGGDVNDGQPPSAVGGGWTTARN